MTFNASFGEGGVEEEEEKEINLEELMKKKNNEISLENAYNEAFAKNTDIFNPIIPKEINNSEEKNKSEYFKEQLIKETIEYTLLNLLRTINNHIYSYKLSFMYKLKYLLNQKYTRLLKAEMIYINLIIKINHLVNSINFINYSKKKKCFGELKIYANIIKHQKEQEDSMKREKEKKIQILKNQLNENENILIEENKKYNELNLIQKKLNSENNELKNKISQLNEKLNEALKIGNSLKNTQKNNKEQENIIKNLKNLIEEKQREKEKAMIDVNNFYQSMDMVLSQYESITKNILPNFDIKKEN